MRKPIENPDGSLYINRTISMAKGNNKPPLVRLIPGFGFNDGDPVKVTQYKDGKVIIEKLSV